MPTLADVGERGVDERDARDEQRDGEADARAHRRGRTRAASVVSTGRRPSPSLTADDRRAEHADRLADDQSEHHANGDRVGHQPADGVRRQRSRRRWRGRTSGRSRRRPTATAPARDVSSGLVEVIDRRATSAIRCSFSSNSSWVRHTVVVRPIDPIDEPANLAPGTAGASAAARRASAARAPLPPTWRGRPIRGARTR